MALKLIAENPTVFDKFEIIEEQNDRKSQSTLYVKGPFIGCNIINKNNRMYNFDDTKHEVDRYINEMIKPQRAMGELNHPACSLASSEILTQKGWMSMVDVQVGDLIPTLNTDTGEIEIHPVEKKIDEPYKGKMYRLKSRNIDLTVTPDHRFPVVRRYGKKEMVKVKDIVADRNKYNKSYIPKLGNWFGEYPDNIIIKGNKTVNPKIFKEDVSKDLIIDTKTFVQFLGIWLAEGHIANNDRYSGYTVGVSQKKEPQKTKIRELLKKFPIEWREYVNSNGCSSFIISDIRLYNYLKPLGNCYNKYIPDEIKNLSGELLEELVYWFNVGDGRFSTTCHENGYIQRNVFTVSRRLIDDLHECLIKSGGCGNITTIITKADYEFAGHIIKKDNAAPLYQLSIATSKGIYLDPRHLMIDEVEVDENVYCVTVKNETFYIRENDKACWSGNSPDVNLERACHVVTELYEEGDSFIGKAKVLSTPCGQILRALINDGVSVGMSTRALGTLEESQDYNVVKNMHLVAIDAVADPSYPKAFVNGILESKSFVLDDDGRYEEIYENLENSLISLPKREVDEYLRKQILKFISQL